jgi:hypothetical protein
MEQKKVCPRQERADRSNVCEYCGHVRCAECKPDRWPNLADGCCACRLRLLSRLPARKASQCREAPRLYGPGLRLVRPAACPLEDSLKGSC